MLVTLITDSTPLSSWSSSRYVAEMLSLFYDGLAGDPITVSALKVKGRLMGVLLDRVRRHSSRRGDLIEETAIVCRRWYDERRGVGASDSEFQTLWAETVQLADQWMSERPEEELAR